ncbi:cytochrome b, partial [Cardiosporidium cionae]
FNQGNNTLPLISFNRISLLQTHLQTYPIPVNINNYWNFGILLAVHYSPSCSEALYSIQHLMREVSHGWFLRYLHSNLASIIFLILYIHMLRALMYNSYVYLPITWQTGLILFIFMIMTAFMGYVLPWGQMSYWAATVILNLFSFLPSLLIWISGAYLLSEPTLKRFFILHFMLPFISLVVVVIHILFLHEASGSNPLGTSSVYSVNFSPTIIFMDMKAIALLLFIIFVQTYMSIITLADPDNLVPANTLITPLQIIPEWYFLTFYSILKSIPSKNAGNTNYTNNKMKYDIVTVFNNSIIPIIICTFIISLQLPLITYISYGRLYVLILNLIHIEV